MHKLTVLTLLSLSLTTACMSEASWPHRDRAGFPMSTWAVRENACHEVRRASEVSPDSLSERQRLLAERCGYGFRGRLLYGPRYNPTTTIVPPQPTRLPSASSPGADPVAQSVAR
jgi:hypothetical protein